MRIYQIIFFFSFLLFGSFYSFSQPSSRADLEKRRASLMNEISETQKLLSETTKDKTATLSQLRAINARLKARQDLINTINSELGHIDKNINLTAKEIEVLNKNLNKFKMQYAQSVRYAYKNRETQSVLAFLFSAKNFNDVAVRMQYLKKYRDYRKVQADKIKQTQMSLNQKIGVLNSEKQQKGQLLNTEEQQKGQILKESNETNEIVKELQGKEKELKSSIAKNKAAAQKLQNAIKTEIQKEIEIARKKAAEEARKKAEEEARKKAAEEARKKAEAEENARRLAAEESARRKAAEDAARKRAEQAGDNYGEGSQSVKLNTGSGASTTTTTPPAKKEEPKEPAAVVVTPKVEQPSYKLSLTPEVQAISNDFSANKGRLPWPVASGFISGPYGQQPHPVYKSVMIENNGIDISTSPGSAVRSVFAGTVIKVTNIDGVVVMISHGEFFTVYSNLSGASVKVGDKVNAKQTIGAAGKNDEGVNMINFQIWKVGNNNSSFTVDPAQWIAR